MELRLAASIFDPQWGVVLASFLFCLVVLLTARSPKAQLFSPWRMFLLANVGGLGISFLRLDRLMSPWAPETWLVWGLAVFAYSCGAWIAHLLPMAGGGGNPAPDDPGRERMLMLALSVPFLVALAGGLATVGTFPVFAREPEVARGAFAFHAPWSGWFFGSVVLVFLFGARVVARGGPRVWRYHALLWGVLLCQMLTGIRGAALFGFFCLASQWEMVRGKVPVAKVLAGVAFFLFLFTGVAILRMGDALKFTKQVPLGTVASIVAGPPYIYIANCYWNLDHGIREILAGNGHPTTWGFSVTAGIWDALGVGGDIGKSLGYESVFNERSAKNASLNTFSFVWPLYKDGGIPFVVLFCVVWGWVAEFLHRLAIRTRSTLWQILSTYLTFASLFSFFALYFIVGSYLMFFLFAIALAFLLERATGSAVGRTIQPAESTAKNS